MGPILPFPAKYLAQTCARGPNSIKTYVMSTLLLLLFTIPYPGINSALQKFLPVERQIEFRPTCESNFETVEPAGVPVLLLRICAIKSSYICKYGGTAVYHLETVCLNQCTMYCMWVIIYYYAHYLGTYIITHIFF